MSVLDASALLAFLQDEPGSDIVEQHLANASMSVVNWCEVVQKLAEVGVETKQLRVDVGDLGVTLETFTVEDSENAAALRSSTKKFGLSLGDRACLALAHRLKKRPVTADKAWAKIAANAIIIR